MDKFIGTKILLIILGQCFIFIPPETSENEKFFDVFNEYRNVKLAKNGLNNYKKSIIQLFMTKYSNPAGCYLFKVIKGNTRVMCEIYLKLTMKTPEQISQIVLVF